MKATIIRYERRNRDLQANFHKNNKPLCTVEGFRTTAETGKRVSEFGIAMQTSLFTSIAIVCCLEV